MKKWQLFLVCITLIFIYPLSAQNEIPNPGFEQWDNNMPAGWVVNSTQFTPTISQSTDAHAGASALKGEVVDFNGVPIPPQFWVGDITSQTIPITQPYTALKGYHKFIPAGADTVVLSVSIFDSNSILLAAGLLKTGTAASNYTEFMIPITYAQTGTAAEASITCTIVGPNGTSGSVGSTLLLDELSFEISVGIEGEPLPYLDKFELAQNYPNPFNPETTIEFYLPVNENVQLSVFNQLGQEVARLVDQPMTAGQHQATWAAQNMPSGVYFYRITTKSFTETRKMLLVR